MTGSGVVRWAGGVLALAVLGGLFLAPGLAVGPSLDASIFSTVGWRLAEGDALYAEVWDHKPPGAYLVSMVAHLLSRDPATAWAIVWGTSLATIVGAALVIARLLARQDAGPLATWAAAALVTIGAGAYLLSLGGGMSETLALLPLAGALAASAAGRWLLAGSLVMVACAVSLQSLPIGGAVAVLAMAGDRGVLVRRAVSATLGMSGVAAVTAIALWLNGGLPFVGDALLAYSAAYRGVTARDGGASTWALVPWTVLVLLPLLVGCGIAAIERRRLANPRLATACVAWVLLGVALIFVQGRFYAHYATPLVLPMAVLAGLGVDVLFRAPRARYRASGVGVVMSASAVLSLLVGAAGAAEEQAPIRASNERAVAAASVLRAATAGEASLFVWGNDARVYELADRRPASRYVYLYPLLTPGYATPERIRRVEEELAAAPPEAVIDTGSLEPGAPGLPPLLVERPLATDGRDLDLLQPLRQLVMAGYVEADAASGWPIYLLARP